MIQKKEYLNYIHFFRGFAILVIVGIHCRISFRWGDHVFSKQLLTTALDNGTILFVFISGFLFEYLRHKFQYTEYLKRKLKYVILPYLLVSILPILLKILDIHKGSWIPDEMVPDTWWQELFFYLRTGKHLGPFWFIPMISIFYLISPLLIKLDNRWFYTWILPVVVIASLFTYKFGFFTDIWISFIYFIPVYLFGMWAASNQEKLTSMSNQNFAILIVLYLSISIAEIAGIIQVPKIGSFEENAELPLFAFNSSKLRFYILSLILIRFFAMMNNRNLPILRYLGDYSFGIYFIHIFFIIGIVKALERYYPAFEMNIWTFLISVAIVTLASIGAVFVIKKIFGRKSRLIIGS